MKQLQQEQSQEVIQVVAHLELHNGRYHFQKLDHSTEF